MALFHNTPIVEQRSGKVTLRLLTDALGDTDKPSRFEDVRCGEVQPCTHGLEPLVEEALFVVYRNA